MTLTSFDLLLQHKALDLVLTTCSSFTGQNTEFGLFQPLLSLQLKDQRESQKAPASLLPSALLLKVSWLPRHQIALQIREYVALPNISLWDVTGTCSCPVPQCKGKRQSPRRREPGGVPVPAIPHVPCPCKDGLPWQREYPCLSAPTMLGKVCPVSTTL